MTIQFVATAWNSGTYVKNIVEVGAGDYTEKSFTPDYNGYNDIQISIFVRSGTTLSNAMVYPMIRLASDPDDTYVPYAMTNRELTEKALMRGLVLTSSNDLNDIKTTGLYGVTTAPTNSPESQTYGTLIVQATSSGDVRQIFIRAGGAGGFVYVRSFGGNPGSWTSWYKFTGTVV